jgi:ribonuclease HI
LIEAYFDGCCEPVNPGGTASFGAVVFIDGVRHWECSRLFTPVKGKERETSNNVAEYSGFVAILEYLITQGLEKTRVKIFGDSNLVIQQMFGTWKMKKGFYIETALKAQKLLKNFPNTTGHWIPREQNGIADELSKAELLKAGVKFKIQPE